MKKIIFCFLFLFPPAVSFGDVIYFPVQYSGFCYSAEMISSFEKARKPCVTSGSWMGVGVVGSFFYPDYPVAGLEFAIERRHYFKPDVYRGFFFSTYTGLAFMTNLNGIYDLGIVPGLKINYKARVSGKFFLEPYMSLSLPFTISLENGAPYPPFPVLTAGLRLSFSELINNLKK